MISSGSFDPWPALRLYWGKVRVYRSRVLALVFVIIGAESMNIAIPWLYRLLVDFIVSLRPPLLEAEWSGILRLLGVILAVRLSGWMLWRISGSLASYLQPRIEADLEADAFAYLLGHSYQFYADSFAGSLVRRVKSLSSSFVALTESFLWRLLPLTVSLVGVGVVLFQRSPAIALAMLVWFLVFVIVSLVYTHGKIGYNVMRAEKDAQVTGALSDALSNSVNVKLFNAYDRESRIFSAVVEERRRLQTVSWRFGERGSLLQNFLNLGIEAAAMFLVLWLWRRGTLTLGDVVLVQGYLIILMQRVYDVGAVVKRVYEAIADVGEMVEILNAPYGIQDVKNAKPLQIADGRIEFRDIVFNYQKTRRVLNGLDLTIEPKEKVALVGSSGAGKTTVVKLLFRFYDLDKGRVMIDGQRISQVTQASLRDAISLVPQDPILFHRSILENIRYGRPEASVSEVILAAKKAHCHEFIQGLPDGYDTLVGERGVKLSGGERQRVAIARAILKNSPILVLDEATSSLDSESESLIQDALGELMKDKTVIVIAHRLSTIMQMDRIVVMKDGKVVDSGKHADLLKKVGIYQTLWNIQAGGFKMQTNV